MCRVTVGRRGNAMSANVSIFHIGDARSFFDVGVKI